MYNTLRLQTAPIMTRTELQQEISESRMVWKMICLQYCAENSYKLLGVNNDDFSLNVKYENGEEHRIYPETVKLYFDRRKKRG